MYAEVVVALSVLVFVLLIVGGYIEARHQEAVRERQQTREFNQFSDGRDWR
jgi:uncharacterized membrane protein